ncbi:hypothetical protein SARC_01891 [Sphaeroforma arctica JP610]|uniref:Uncharacterized protein n=1 Tax=Sphaeroforma arctica JP610 TaxID=667725 RepID=A0A0L0GAL1_9EUKA|nr:hypothetical protein SARC_01891 [Sphaeroforma arctica JP610]KNC85944.1 hypothetical protein SARC_01891 [Sphaeroforma arctica JP610]|eukprot:XP_014159846.1 hypothetical protein SARC_01891 [Sphaeroforma arctica JP610]
MGGYDYTRSSRIGPVKRNWLQKKYFLWEVTFATYMLEPWERLLFDIIWFTLSLLAFYSLSLFLPDFGISRTISTHIKESGVIEWAQIQMVQLVDKVHGVSEDVKKQGEYVKQAAS